MVCETNSDTTKNPPGQVAAGGSEWYSKLVFLARFAHEHTRAWLQQQQQQVHRQVGANLVMSNFGSGGTIPTLREKDKT